jgi:KDO2-lipid IV(A) lauroyltransferase
MFGGRSKILFNAAMGSLAVGTLRALKLMNREHSANLVGALMRKLGPRLPEHRIGRDNLRASFSEKSDAEIEAILAGVWDNLGRVAVEFVHLDELRVTSSGQYDSDTVVLSPETAQRYERIRRSGKPVVAFAAHLANWELPGLAIRSLGFQSAILYRRPNISAISDAVIRLRTPLMGELVPTGFDAPVRLGRLLQNGIHVGMLADQHYGRGVETIFFGRRCLTNPLIALLARQVDCPIHGLRVVRLPDRNRFWGEITDPIAPVRDAEGRIDVKGTTQAITSVIEGWVREHPEQWLWLHRRWR